MLESIISNIQSVGKVVGGIKGIVNAFGGLFGGGGKNKQKEFAQEGIRWRVKDAQLAGIHPLYALGASLPTYSPEYPTGDLGGALGDMGQNVERAARQGMTEDERQLLDLQKRKLEAEIMRTNAEAGYAISRTQALNQPAAVQPAVPAAAAGAGGVVGPGSVKVLPSEVKAHAVGDPSSQAGVPSMWQWRQTRLGPVKLPTQESGEIIENTFGPLAPVAVGGMLAGEAVQRIVAGPEQKPGLKLPPGYEWVWHPVRQAFVAKKRERFDAGSGVGPAERLRRGLWPW